jgi:hypothetical protein
MNTQTRWTKSISLVVCLFGLLGIAATGAGQSPERTYVWFGQFATLESDGKTATLKAPINEAVTGYVSQFKPGDRVVLTWDMIGKTEADTVLHIAAYQTMKSAKVDFGYILPVEFVAADTAARTVTFKTVLPDAQAQALKAATAGATIKVVTPWNQPAEHAAIRSVELSNRAQPAAGEKG